MAINKDKVLQSAQKYLLKGQIDKAIKEYQKIIEEDPNDVRITLKIGDLYTKAGDTAAATEAYLKVADFYSSQGFYLKAVAVYKQILKIDNTLIDVNAKLAEHYHQLGLVGDALVQYQQVAVYYEQNGQTKEALDCLRKMIDLDMENVPCRIKLGELLAKEGLKKEAIREFAMASETLKKQGRIDDYMKVAEHLSHLLPENIQLIQQLANYYVQKGDVKRALSKLQLCFRFNPQDVTTLSLLGDSFVKLNQTDKATSVFRELLKIYLANNDLANCQLYAKKILGIVPDDKDCLEILATCQSSGGFNMVPVDDGVVEEVEEAPDFVMPPPPDCTAIPMPLEESMGGMHIPNAGESAVVARITANKVPADTLVNQMPAFDYGQPEEDNSEFEKLFGEAQVFTQYGLEAKAFAQLKSVMRRFPRQAAGWKEYRRLAINLGEDFERQKAESALAGLGITSFDDGEGSATTAVEAESTGTVENNPAAAEEESSVEIELQDEEEEIQVDEETEAAEVEVEVAMDSDDGEEVEVSTEDEIEVETEDEDEAEDVPQAAVPVMRLVTGGQNSIPLAPLAPETPVIPSVSLTAEEPIFPDSPLAPVAPLAPIAPLAPLSPITPLPPIKEPVSEETASAPVFPVMPVAPLDVAALPDLNLAASAVESRPVSAEIQDGSFDLGSELDDLFDMGEDAQVEESPADDMQIGMSEVLAEFKRGIAKTVSDEDYTTHYDLGQAYMEMGLIDEAVFEFEKAAQFTAKEVEAYHMIGLCYMQGGRATEAASAFRQALNSDYISQPQRLGMRYELAVALEADGDTAEALQLYEKVYLSDDKFRDVATRYKNLKATMEAAMEEENISDTEADSGFDPGSLLLDEEESTVQDVVESPAEIVPPAPVSLNEEITDPAIQAPILESSDEQQNIHPSTIADSNLDVVKRVFVPQSLVKEADPVSAVPAAETVSISAPAQTAVDVDVTADFDSSTEVIAKVPSTAKTAPAKSSGAVSAVDDILSGINKTTAPLTRRPSGSARRPVTDHDAALNAILGDLNLDLKSSKRRSTKAPAEKDSTNKN